jgi:diguanylate cyclase (GGDEF)-like protein
MAATAGSKKTPQANQNAPSSAFHDRQSLRRSQGVKPALLSDIVPEGYRSTAIQNTKTMKIQNRILESGFSFDAEKEEYLAFRFRLFNMMMLVAAVFALLFGAMHDLGINPINDFHAKVDYLYSLTTLTLILLLRRSKDSFNLIMHLFLIASFATFVSAFINVPQDEFRAIWFFLLVFAAYTLGGTAIGAWMTLSSTFAIIFINLMYPGLISANAIFSVVLGLIIFSLISFVFTQKSTEYAEALIRKNAELHTMAGRDPLTGIFNTRMYYTVGEQIFQLAQRDKKPLSLLFIDIDHFKRINDEYGHDTGDKVLMKVAQAITGALRKSDVTARIGGEEFAVILPNTDIHGGNKIAEKIRESVELLECDEKDKVLQVTASIGVGMITDTDNGLDDIKRRSDEAMYQAKRTGRNRVVLANLHSVENPSEQTA